MPTNRRARGKVKCPTCEIMLSISRDQAGKRIRCPNCEVVFRLKPRKTSKRKPAVRHYVTFLAGARYRNEDGSSRTAHIKTLQPLKQLRLRHENESSQGSNTIAVMDGDYQIGWLRQNDAAEVLEKEDGGYLMACLFAGIVDKLVALLIVEALPGTGAQQIADYCNENLKYAQPCRDCKKVVFAPTCPHCGAVNVLTRSQLQSMDPIEFESLIAKLLQTMGLEAETTEVTGDGGIDIVAHSSQPIIGGKFIVQCKRYAPDNRVGVSAVRDLYGVVTSERASKGILVTTSDFTAKAREFADGKPLELVDGEKLVSLLRTHGPEIAEQRSFHVAKGQDSSDRPAKQRTGSAARSREAPQQSAYPRNTGKGYCRYCNCYVAPRAGYLMEVPSRRGKAMERIVCVNCDDRVEQDWKKYTSFWRWGW